MREEAADARRKKKEEKRKKGETGSLQDGCAVEASEIHTYTNTQCVCVSVLSVLLAAET